MFKPDFSVTRLFFLIRIDISLYRKQIVVCLAAIILLVGTGFFMNTLYFEDPELPHAMLVFFLISGGALLSSVAFQDYFCNTAGIVQFILPASSAEKYLSRWILIMIGYPLIILAIFYLLRAIAGQFSPQNTLRDIHYFFRDVAGFYLVLSIFFFGSVRFRSIPFFKTLVSVLAISIVVVVLSQVIIYFVFQHVPSASTNAIYRFFRPDYTAVGTKAIFDQMIGIVTQTVFLPSSILLIGIPALWIAGYFQLKESEI